MSYLKLVVYSVVLALLAYLGYGYYTGIQAKKDLAKAQTVITGINQEIGEYQSKNHQLVNTVYAMETKVSSIQYLNRSLFDSIKTLKVKVKDLQSVSSITQTITVHNTDTLRIYSNDSLTLDNPCAKVKMIVKDSKVAPNDLSIEIKNNQTILVSTVYKRWWLFWRKATGVQVHIKNTNPCLVNTDVQYYKLY